jgi:hypothetical protein
MWDLFCLISGLLRSLEPGKYAEKFVNYLVGLIEASLGGIMLDAQNPRLLKPGILFLILFVSVGVVGTLKYSPRAVVGN